MAKKAFERTWVDYTNWDPKTAAEDPLEIYGFDHIELYAGNARQATYYYCHAYGFTPVAYRGPETGYREAASYVLRQGEIQIVITSPLQSTSKIAHHIQVHGDSVKDVAFEVANCEAFYHECLKRGAKSACEPEIWKDDTGEVKRAAIQTYGDVIHSIVERKGYSGDFWPGFVPFNSVFRVTPSISDAGLFAIDHIVGNVELGKMDYWVSFYKEILGFDELRHFTEDDISTEYSALMSKVVKNGTGKVKLPINEPAKGKRRSQIDEYLDFNVGAGVQHVAMATNNIVQSVSHLKENGVGFLYVPQTYYEDLDGRVGSIDENVDELSKLGVLVDRDDDGYLLQLFTKPVLDRPTLFFEIIQRRGSQGFGVGNFKALFEAIEREQELRGNL